MHKITKPTAWRGGIQILEEEDEDVRSLARCEEKKTEWAEQWQHNTDVQDLKDMLWRNEELISLEEGMTRLEEGDSEKAARNYMASTGVGCNGFRTEVPLELSKRTRGDVVEFLQKVARCGRWPQ